MRPERDDHVALWDMLKFARLAEEIAKKTTLEALLADQFQQLALERAIEVVGEAARKVSRQFEEGHPEIPWKLIVAQRHVLAHEYGEIKHERLWRVATTHVPTLIQQLEAVLSEDKAP